MISGTAALPQSYQPSENDIRLYVDRIAASQPFVRSRQLADLLRFLVNVTTGEEMREWVLKEYTIAVNVLGREKTFNPANDTIVRVEMRRLRRRLGEYYRGEGILDRVHIEIPKGSYRPQFQIADEKVRDLSGAEAWHYRFLQRLAAGHSASLYAAESLTVHRPVLVLLFTKGTLNGSLPMVQHPGVLPVLEVHKTANGAAIATDHPQTETMEEWMERTVLAQPALWVGRQLLEVLWSGHSAGLAHGGIRPGIIWLQQLPLLPASQPWVRVLPYPLADTAIPVAEPDPYRAPERSEGAAASRESDIFEWAVVVSDLLRRSGAENEKNAALLAACREADPAKRVTDVREIAEAWDRCT